MTETAVNELSLDIWLLLYLSLDLNLRSTVR